MCPERSVTYVSGPDPKGVGGEGGILNIVAEPCLALHRLAVLTSSKSQERFNLAPCSPLCPKELQASETRLIRRNSVAKKVALRSLTMCKHWWYLKATPRTIIIHVRTHEIRHWAQIVTVLRLNGSKGDFHDFIFSPVLGGEFRTEQARASS
jgi:hypothetical protein